MSKGLFIKTSDVETKNTLLKEGFNLVSSDSGVWTFINEGKKINFAEDNKNIVYTNMLNV